MLNEQDWRESWARECKAAEALAENPHFTSTAALEAAGFRLLALARRAQGVACELCNGFGRRSYPSTATYHKRALAGRAFTEDTCDLCWGTGRNDSVGTAGGARPTSFQEPIDE